MKRLILTSSLAVAGLCFLSACGSVGTAQTDLRRAVDAQQSALNECYRVALTRDEDTSGDLRVRLAMARKTTTVSDVSVLESDVDDAALTSCINDVLSGVSIEEGPGVDIEVDYTVSFQPQPR